MVEEAKMMAEPWVETLRRGARELNLALSDQQVDQFRTFLSRLLEWDPKLNLTAITELKEIAIKHFVDSLSCLAAVAITPGMKVIDVGTGAGFPGIPLAIYQPKASMVLVESSRKRVRFLEDLRDELGIPTLRVLCARAEELGRKENYREKFDLAVSRAVASLEVLAEYCLPLVRIGGKFIAQKGPKGKEELTAAERILQGLGGKLSQVIELELPEGRGARSLIVVEKVAITPANYPRRPGVAIKQAKKEGKRA